MHPMPLQVGVQRLHQCLREPVEIVLTFTKVNVLMQSKLGRHGLVVYVAMPDRHYPLVILCGMLQLFSANLRGYRVRDNDGGEDVSALDA